MLSHYGFYVFPQLLISWGIFFHLFIGHLWFFCELPIHDLCSFFSWNVLLFLIDLQEPPFNFNEKFKSPAQLSPC